MSDRLQIAPEHAEKFLGYFNTRGGVLCWSSADLSDPGWSRWTPALTEDGESYPKPHWKADSKPVHLTDASQLDVVTELEVRRFKVALRQTGPFGATFKCTDASSRKIHTAIDKVNATRADKDAWYEFDYETQECVIYVPSARVPLSKYQPAVVAAV